MLCSQKTYKGKMDSVLIMPTDTLLSWMQKKWGLNFPEEDTLPWLLLPRRCFSFYSTLKDEKWAPFLFFERIAAFGDFCRLWSPHRWRHMKTLQTPNTHGKGTLPHTLRASRPVVYEHTAVLHFCNKPEGYANAHICYAEAEKGLRMWACAVKWVLPFSSPELATCSWNNFKQTLRSLKFLCSTAMLHIMYCTLQGLHNTVGESLS